MATFGYSSLMADIIYIWAIQYYGNTAIPDKFDYFVHIFSIISELDPRYVDPYEVGALIAFYDAKDIALALKFWTWDSPRTRISGSSLSKRAITPSSTKRISPWPGSITKKPWTSRALRPSPSGFTPTRLSR